MRKSPTPLVKTTTSNPINNNNGHHSLQKNRPLNDSQLSLLSDRSTTNKYNLSIGIPHNDHNHNYRQNYLPQQLQNNHNNGVAAFKMPMNLEDLDDLLKYADEHQGEGSLANKQKQDENGNGQMEGVAVPGKELLTAKGSNNSIGQLSNMCSSGYQSISTQSQSSSPIETGAGQLDFLNNKNRHLNPRNGPLKYQFGGTKATQNAVLGKSHSSQKSSSLTPSSSEERLSEDHLSSHHHHHLQPQQHHYGHLNHSAGSQRVAIGEIRGESELNMIASSLNGRSPVSSMGTNGRRGGYNRTPRTNPMYYNSGTAERVSGGGSAVGLAKDDELSVSLPYSSMERPVGKHLNGSRYQRRLSMESARTLSDSSSDTEGGFGKTER